MQRKRGITDPVCESIGAGRVGFADRIGCFEPERGCAGDRGRVLR